MSDPAPSLPAKRQRWSDAPWVRKAIGTGLSLYVRLVRRTNQMEFMPPDMYERYTPLQPFIIVAWHANVLAMPLFVSPKRGVRDITGLTSPHADGQIAAAFINAFGLRTVEGTGRSHKATAGTGGTAGFRKLMRELADGHSVFLTAEIPPIRGRKVSRGVIELARKSGRPIIAVAAASSRRTVLERVWDKMQINHPFGRMVLVASTPVEVTEETDDAMAMAELKRLLDEAYAAALARADAPRLRA